ncbi:MAG: UTRA domain-containing protein, partial [Ruthenibacterium sp.]
AIEEFSGFVPSIAKNTEQMSVKEQTKVLRLAGDKFANMFRIEPSDLIYYIRRVLFVDAEPVSVEEVYLPRAVIPQLDVVNSSVFSLSDVFAFYGVGVSKVRQNLEIVECGVKIRRALEVPDGVAVMMLEYAYDDVGGSVIEYSRMYTRSDKCSFKVSM